MTKITKIFSVSLIAFVTVIGGAYAEIASVGYVDKIVSGLNVDSRELVSNKVKSADIEANQQSEDKYPSMKTSYAIANIAAAAAVNDISISGGTATAGKVVTSLTKNNGEISATMDYVKIPVGSPTSPTGVATIWVE